MMAGGVFCGRALFVDHLDRLKGRNGLKVEEQDLGVTIPGPALYKSK